MKKLGFVLALLLSVATLAVAYLSAKMMAQEADSGMRSPSV